MHNICTKHTGVQTASWAQNLCQSDTNGLFSTSLNVQKCATQNVNVGRLQSIVLEYAPADINGGAPTQTYQTVTDYTWLSQINAYCYSSNQQTITATNTSPSTCTCTSTLATTPPTTCMCGSYSTLNTIAPSQCNSPFSAGCICVGTGCYGCASTSITANGVQCSASTAIVYFNNQPTSVTSSTGQTQYIVYDSLTKATTSCRQQWFAQMSIVGGTSNGGTVTTTFNPTLSGEYYIRMKSICAEPPTSTTFSDPGVYIYIYVRAYVCTYARQCVLCVSVHNVHSVCFSIYPIVC